MNESEFRRIIRMWNVPPRNHEWFRQMFAQLYVTDPQQVAARLRAPKRIIVILPPGHRPLITIARSKKKVRLPRDLEHPADRDKPLLIPMVTAASEEAQNLGVFMNVFPQQVIVHAQIAKRIAEETGVYSRWVPPMDNASERLFNGARFHLGRWDVVINWVTLPDGHVLVYIGLCEIDDVCSLWAAYPHIQPVVSTHVTGIWNRLSQAGYKLRLVELPEFEDGRDPSRSNYFFAMVAGRRVLYEDLGNGRTRLVDGWKVYHHNDQEGLEYLGPDESLDDVLVYLRGRWFAPGFGHFVRKYGRRALTATEDRDFKFGVAGGGYGVLAPRDIAIEGALAVMEETRQALVDAALATGSGAVQGIESRAIFVIKGRSCWTDGVAPIVTGDKRRGEFSAAQAVAKLDAYGCGPHDPVVVMPYHTPPTAARMGITFRPGDREVIQAVGHLGGRAGDRFVPGAEGDMMVVGRLNEMADGSRIYVPGGLFQFRDASVIDGAADVGTVGAVTAGLEPDPDGDADPAALRAFVDLQRIHTPSEMVKDAA